MKKNLTETKSLKKSELFFQHDLKQNLKDWTYIILSFAEKETTKRKSTTKSGVYPSGAKKD